jgi:hypothetical protein
MVENGYEKLIKEANESIPLYTTLLDTLKQIIDTQNRTINHLAQIDPDIELEVFKENEQINKFNALITISVLNLLVVCKNLCLATSEWEKIYFTKQGYLVMYETIKTYYKYRSQLQKIIETKHASFKGTFKSINDDLKQFKKKHDYDNLIGLIRNKVAGHIDEDFVLYYNTIAKLDGEKVGLTISHFIQVIAQLQNLSKDLSSNTNHALEVEGKTLSTMLAKKVANTEEELSKLENVKKK